MSTSRSSLRSGRPPPADRLRWSSPDRLLETMIALSADLNILLREEELVHRFVQALAELLPGRLLSVRLVDPATLELSLVYATGRLEQSRRDRLSVSSTALEAAGGEPEPLVSRGIAVDGE